MTDTTSRTSTTDTYAPGELDLHLIGEGRHEELWTVLGAHTRSRSRSPASGPAGTGRSTR